MITQKIALITGSTGQDDSFVAEFLFEKGDIVHGIKRRASSFNTTHLRPVILKTRSTIFTTNGALL